MRRNRERPRWRKPGGMHARSTSMAPEASEALERFLADIRDTPVLKADEEAELARTLRAAREGLRDTLGRIPYAVELLLRAWQRRRDAGRTLAALSEVHDSNPAFAAKLDARLAEIAELAERRGKPGTRAAERRGLDARIARGFSEVDPRTDMLLGFLESVERRARKAGARPERSLGLPRRALETTRSEARAHRDAYHAAKDAFVRHNLRLVVHMAKDYRHLDLPFADLVQEGNLGLIRAVEKFDERKGFRFSTYAAWWISQAFIRAAQRQSRTVRLPSHVHQRLLRLQRLEAEYDRLYRRPPTPEEVGEALELGAEDVSHLLRARSRPTSIDESDADEDRRPLTERIPDDVAEEPSALLDADALEAAVRRSLEVLEPREREIVAARFELDQGQRRTLQSLADELGLSRERVRQIEKRALEKLARTDEAQALHAHLE